MEENGGREEKKKRRKEKGMKERGKVGKEEEGTGRKLKGRREGKQERMVHNPRPVREIFFLSPFPITPL